MNKKLITIIAVIAAMAIAIPSFALVRQAQKMPLLISDDEPSGGCNNVVISNIPAHPTLIGLPLECPSGELNNIIFSWTTNEPSDTVVKYGISPENLANIVSSPEKVTSHSITVYNWSGFSISYALNSSSVCASVQTGVMNDSWYVVPRIPNCIDTDSFTYPTINADINGTVKIRGDQTLYPDSCQDTIILKEAYCQNSCADRPTFVNITCASGCLDGRCI